MRREKGFLLITLYMLMPLLLVVALGLASRAFADIRATLRIQASTQALYLAEGGIDEAIVQLRNDQEWEGGEGALPTGAYNIQVEELEDDRFRLTSVGSSTFLNTPIDRSVEAIVEVQETPLFRYAVFSDFFTDIWGTASTDSYDSREGPYNAATAGEDGDVGNNAPGATLLMGHPTIRGDVICGAGQDPNVAIGLKGSPTVTGGQYAADEPFELPEVEIPSGLSSSGTLNIKGNKTVTLPGGTYLFDSVAVTGGGKLEFTGPAEVYVTGVLSIHGSGVGTASNLPPDLIVYMPNWTGVTFTGNSTFYGALYAPKGLVYLGGTSEVFGAVVSFHTWMTGTQKVHYDEALGEIGGAEGNEVSVLSWQDVS